MHVSKQFLTKKGGVYFDPRMKYTMTMFEEYIEGAGGGKPKKKTGDLLHGCADSYQYICSYVCAGLDTHRPEPIKRKRKPKKRRKRYL